jgi:hypothetical protein
MDAIRAVWQGNEKLWKVFWLYNTLLGSALLYAMDYSARLGTIVEVAIYLVVLVWVVWVAVGLWRCAFNTQWRIWGYLARGAVILTVAGGILAIAAPFMGIDPESL